MSVAYWDTSSSNRIRYEPFTEPRLVSPTWNPVHIVLASTDELGPTSRQILGDEGHKRFEEFKQYTAGWDMGSGSVLSYRSVAVMETFLNRIRGYQLQAPNLFFTRAGNLQLGWKSRNGDPVEVEFFPDRMEFYLGPTSEEGAVDTDVTGVRRLLEKLQQATAAE